MIKKIILLLLILTGISLAKNPGSGYRAFGIGVMIGKPTGINMKFWRMNETAFDTGLAWSFGKESSFSIHADYLVHNYWAISSYRGNMPFYYGIGGRIKFQSEEKNSLGLRIPLGMAYHFLQLPVDLFFEIGPIVDFIPATEFDFDIGIGARFYFK